MSMKPYAILAVSALALTVAGCGGGPPKVRAALDCPNTEGGLTRTSKAPDGKACTYVSSEGAEVTLQLVSAPGGPDAVLQAIETNLLAAQGSPSDDKSKAVEKGDAPAKADAGSAKDASTAAAEAAADAKAASGDAVDEHSTGKDHFSLNGNLVIDDDDGKTHVDMPGIHIDSDDSKDSANVQIGPLHVQAGEHGAVIRIRRDVRLRGEALSHDKRGIRATFISEGSSRTDGYRFVGYEAAGPKVGPITVAVVRAKSEVDQGDKVYRSVKRLVRENGGV